MAQAQLEMVAMPAHLAEQIKKEHILMFAALAKIKETTGLFEVSGEAAGLVQEAHKIADDAIKALSA